MTRQKKAFKLTMFAPFSRNIKTDRVTFKSMYIFLFTKATSALF